MSNSLELDIYPLGEVSHAAVDAANYGSCRPGVFVHFGSAVELGHPAFFLEASLEVGVFCFRQCFGVGLHKQLELEGGRIKSLFGFSLGEALVGCFVQEVVCEASLFVEGSVRKCGSKVLVTVECNEVLVGGHILEELPWSSMEVVFSLLAS